jgi:ABC-type sugar transport system ATPase subunit
VVLGLRPEAFEAASRADPTLPRTTVRPTVIEQLGAETHLVFNLDAPRFTARDIEVAFDNEDDQLLADEAQASFTARVSVQHDARVGQPIELAIDPSELHFFDPATSDRLRLT